MQRLPRFSVCVVPLVRLAMFLFACGSAWQLAAAVADEGILSRLLGSGSTEKSDAGATHAFKKAVTVKTSDGNGVQTFCLDGRGRVVALAAPARYFSGASGSSDSEVHILTNDGEPVTHWKVDFAGQSINVGPDGTIYVAGDAKIAKFGPDGKLLKRLELPHIAELLKNTKEIRKQAERQLAQTKRTYDQILKQYRERVKTLEAKPEGDLTRQDKFNLDQSRRVLKTFEQQLEQQMNDQNVDQVVKSTTSRLRIINSVAISKRDVFIVCGEASGYGFALWRMDPDFQNAKEVMRGMRGCCGQMDVQVDGDGVLVAENCEHAFARYDRDGKKLGQWGKVTRGDDVKCFGGCCNPMNVRCGPKGDIFTAESEGLIKRFSPQGDFVALVGKRPLSGGCKNVAVAASPDGKYVYFCDQPGSQIIIMEQKAKSVAQSGL
jgi:ribosomal protein L24E